MVYNPTFALSSSFGNIFPAYKHLESFQLALKVYFLAHLAMSEDEALDSGPDEVEEDSDPESTEPEDDTQLFRIVRPKKHRVRWKKRDLKPVVHPFTGNPGIKVPLTRDSSILEIFKNFFPDTLLARIARESNRFAKQEGLDKPRGVKGAQWRKITTGELQAVFALILLMGFVQKPTMEVYWELDEMTETPFWRHTMPRNRFFSILAALHFNNNKPKKKANKKKMKKDRLWKLRPVLDTLQRTFMETLTPQRTISTDESLLKFKGRISFWMYNPAKRSRFGFKVYKTCQTGGLANGYIWNFQVYTADKKSDDTLESTRIVMDLNQTLLGKGYNLFLDNWYSSPDLFIDLFRNKTNACGTVRANRRFYPEDLKVLKPYKLKRGDVQYRSTGKGILALVWRDKKDVRLLSTMHSAPMEDSGKKTLDGEVIVKPSAVLSYNAGMGGVDSSDQFASAYTCARKSVKWYRKLFYHFMDMVDTNSFITYRQLGGRFSHMKFRRELCRQLLRDAELPVYLGLARRKSRSVRRPIPTQHKLVWIPATENKERPTRRCVLCTRDGVRKETRYMCGACELPLCVVPCSGKHQDGDG